MPDAPEYFHLGLYSLEDVVIVELLGVKDLDGHFPQVNHGQISPTWAARGGFATSREVHLGGCALAELLEKLVPRLDVVYVMVGEVSDAAAEHFALYRYFVLARKRALSSPEFCEAGSVPGCSPWVFVASSLVYM